MTKQCKNCKFFKPVEPSGSFSTGYMQVKGWCLRRAPTLASVGMGAYPPTYPEGWCGEWEKKI